MFEPRRPRRRRARWTIAALVAVALSGLAGWVAQRLAERPLPTGTELESARRALPPLKKGIRLSQEGRYDEAIAAFERALAADPDNPAAQRYLDEARSMRGRSAALLVDFQSELPQGTLTLFAGPDQIYEREFQFSRGAFRRLADRLTGNAGGEMEDELRLPAGHVDLRVYVLRRGNETLQADVEGELPAGGSRILRIHLDRQGELRASLETPAP